MKRVWCGAALLVLGVVLILLPYHIGMTGICAMGYGFLCLLDWLCGRNGWKKGLRNAIRTVAAVSLAALVIGMAVIGWSGRVTQQPDQSASYAVVLGAQIQGDRPSRTLRERLDAAMALQKKCPGMTIILSGGQGSDEKRSEAAVMYDYLEAKGAVMERVLKEEASSNTRENLTNSAALARSIGLNAESPLIVTSEFHLCRAEYIARTLGLEPSGWASRTTPRILMLNYLLREVFAFGKAWVVATASS